LLSHGHELGEPLPPMEEAMDRVSEKSPPGTPNGIEMPPPPDEK